MSKGTHRGEGACNNIIIEHNNTVHITCPHVQNAFLRLGNGVCYKLVGVIIHHDLGYAGGHYTCYFHDHSQNQWIFFANDGKVTVITYFQWVCMVNTLIL